MDDLVRDLRDAHLDLIVWVSQVAPTIEARHSWTEPLVWVRGPSFRLDPALPVPLVSYGEDCPFTRASVAHLHEAKRNGEIVFMGSSLLALAGAVSSGLGVSVLPAVCAMTAGMCVWHDAPLPALPALHCGIYVRPGADSAGRDQLADVLAQSLRQPESRSDAAE